MYVVREGSASVLLAILKVMLEEERNSRASHNTYMFEHTLYFFIYYIRITLEK